MNKVLLCLVVALALTCGLLGYLWRGQHDANALLQEQLHEKTTEADVYKQDADDSWRERTHFIAQADSLGQTIAALQRKREDQIQHHVEEREYVDTAGRDALRAIILRPMP